MALRNDGSRMFDFNGNILISSPVLFSQAEHRLKEKKDLIADLQNEYDLLEQQAFNLYRNHVDYMKLDISFFDSAQKWLSMQKSGTDADGNKLDGRKKYKEKDIAEYLFSTLSEYLGIDDLEVLSIMDFNYNEAKIVVFTSHNEKWELYVPIVDGIRIDSYRTHGACWFKIHLSHYDSEHYTSFVGDTFVEEELKEIMQKGIDKYIKQENQ